MFERKEAVEVLNSLLQIQILLVFQGSVVGEPLDVLVLELSAARQQLQVGERRQPFVVAMHNLIYAADGQVCNFRNCFNR